MTKYIFSADKFLYEKLKTIIYHYEHGRCSIQQDIYDLTWYLYYKDKFPLADDGKEWEDLWENDEQKSDTYCRDLWCKKVEVPDYEVSDGE